jgi:hypothetical protein
LEARSARREEPYAVGKKEKEIHKFITEETYFVRLHTKRGIVYASGEVEHKKLYNVNNRS